MPITPQQLKLIEQLPRPPAAGVALVSKDGRPTQAFTDYLSRLHAWQQTVIQILGAL